LVPSSFSASAFTSTSTDDVEGADDSAQSTLTTAKNDEDEDGHRSSERTPSRGHVAAAYAATPVPAPALHLQQLLLPSLHIVHRLDRLVSGLLVVAVGRATAQRMTQQLMLKTATATGSVGSGNSSGGGHASGVGAGAGADAPLRKQYIACVRGKFPVDPIVCTLPIVQVDGARSMYGVGTAVAHNNNTAAAAARDDGGGGDDANDGDDSDDSAQSRKGATRIPQQGRRRAGNENGGCIGSGGGGGGGGCDGAGALSGKGAETRFRRLRYAPAWDVSLVECVPLTGRQHQIRVHLAALGFPILNDEEYGGVPSDYATPSAATTATGAPPPPAPPPAPPLMTTMVSRPKTMTRAAAAMAAGGGRSVGESASESEASRQHRLMLLLGAVLTPAEATAAAAVRDKHDSEWVARAVAPTTTPAAAVDGDGAFDHAAASSLADKIKLTWDILNADAVRAAQGGGGGGGAGADGTAGTGSTRRFILLHAQRYTREGQWDFRIPSPPAWASFIFDARYENEEEEDEEDEEA
jgi:hypothetical protein